MKNYSQQASQINERINELSSFSDGEGVTRIFGSESFLACSSKIEKWMQHAGLQTRVDNMGNIRGKWQSKNPDAKTLLIGSHLDTVINGGKYEGTLGILAGLNVIETLISENISLPFHVELVAFSENEGIRFNYSYLGSEVVAGTFQNKLLEIKDQEGNTLSQLLKSLNHDPGKIKDDAIPAEDLLGYFEIHIEQGNLLYKKNIPVGVVNSISGQKRIEIKFAGKAGHAGTVPMDERKDALCAAAKFILAVEKYALREKGDLLATVGKLNIESAAGNIIPGTVICTVDLRSNDVDTLSEAYEAINYECENICDKRNIYFEWKLKQEINPVVCNKKMRKILSNSITEKNIELIQIDSGAAHDAAIIAKVAPIAMLFVRCYKSIGETSVENVELSDIAKTLEVAQSFLLQLASPPEKLLKKKEK